MALGMIESDIQTIDCNVARFPARQNMKLSYQTTSYSLHSELKFVSELNFACQFCTSIQHFQFSIFTLSLSLLHFQFSTFTHFCSFNFALKRAPESWQLTAVCGFASQRNFKITSASVLRNRTADCKKNGWHSSIL